MPPRLALSRFFVPDARASGDLVSLPTDEAQHLTRVLRLGAGDGLRVFDGRGAEFEATVEESRHGDVRVRLGRRVEAVAEPRVSITLAQAVLKGDKMDDVVRDAVMMGVAVVQPLISTRTEVSLAALTRGRRQERWERVAVAAAKQCGRAVVPRILPPHLFGDVVTAVSEGALPAPAIMLVEPAAAADATALSALDLGTPRAITVLVGPEGGWTREEVEQGAAACRRATLGARTLRADAMAVVALAALFTLVREY